MFFLGRTIALFLVLALAVTASSVYGFQEAQEHSTPAAEVAGELAPEAAAGGHDAGEASHDMDPTHGNVSDKTYGIVDFRTDIAFFTAIVFLLLLAGLYFTAWTPIMQGLEKREQGIADNINRAEKAAADAQSKLAQYEAKLATAHEEAQAIVGAARKDAESMGQKLVAAAQEEAVRQRERATADIESAKRVALSELASQSTDVAMFLASRVVGREVRADDHQGLIQEMLSKLPSNN